MKQTIFKIIVLLFNPIVCFSQSQSKLWLSSNFASDPLIKFAFQTEWKEPSNWPKLAFIETPLSNVEINPQGYKWISKSKRCSNLNSPSVFLLNSNPHATFTAEKPSLHYFTFSNINAKFRGTEKIIFKDVYSKIDWIVEVNKQNPNGFKYTWRLLPGAVLTDIKYSAKHGVITVSSDQKSMQIAGLLDTLSDGELKVYNQNGESLAARFIQNEKFVSIHIDEPYNPRDTIYIDPWVTKISSLKRLRSKDNGSPDNIGANLDYDYANNLYVYGGQSVGSSSWDTTIRFSGYKVAKFNKDGVLQWVFSGDISLSSFPSRYVDETLSNILVDKSTGKLLVGCNNILQEPAQLIRLDSMGMYDNFTYDTSYHLNAIDELHFDPYGDRVIAFGNKYSFQGDSFELDVKTIGKPSSSRSVTGKLFPAKKQILCATQDYSGTSHVRFCTYDVDTSITNYVYSTPQNYQRYQFKSPSGLMVDSNAFHWRRYRINNLKTVFYGATNDLVANDNYIFESDGKTLSAIDKKTHKAIGYNYITPNRKMALATGMAADPCNHVFVAGDSGNILCLSINGNGFQLDSQILVWGVKKSCVIQDLKYNPNAQLIFATGDSFVGSFRSPYNCRDTSLEIIASSPCDPWMVASIKNPDTASVYTFQWVSTDNDSIKQQKTIRHHFSDTLSASNMGENYALRIYRNKRIGGYYRDYTFQRFPNSASTQSLQFCAADTWIHNGFSHHRDTTFTDSLKNQFGCDSLIQYKLTFKPRSFTFLNPKICRGDSFSVGKRTYRISGNYADTFTNVRGCDSIVNTSLTVLTDTSLSIKTAICLGDTIRFNNLPFFATGSYQIKTIRSNGCDSVINLQLTVNPPKFVPQQLSLCNTDSFAYRNNKYPLPLSLRDTLSASTGCDSVFELSVISHNIKSDFSIDSSQFPTLKFIGKTNNAKQWIWDFGDLNSSNLRSPSHIYVKSFQWINYKICLVVRDSFGCDDTLCFNLPIKPEAEIQIPEGISPNGDGINDTLVIPGLWAFPKASWVIFNRWGQVVFESNAQQNIAWDGRNHASGQSQSNKPAELLAEGVYYIVFNYNDGHRPKLSKNIYLKR